MPPGGQSANQYSANSINDVDDGNKCTQQKLLSPSPSLTKKKLNAQLNLNLPGAPDPKILFLCLCFNIIFLICDFFFPQNTLFLSIMYHQQPHPNIYTYFPEITKNFSGITYYSYAHFNLWICLSTLGIRIHTIQLLLYTHPWKNLTFFHILQLVTDLQSLIFVVVRCLI